MNARARRLSSRPSKGRKEDTNDLRNGELAAWRVARHEPFIAMHARNWSGSYGVDLDDLMQEGRIAVAHASGRFREDKGVHFLTYARWWIRSRMQGFTFDNCNQVRVPVNRFLELRTRETSLDEPVSQDEPYGPTLGEIFSEKYLLEDDPVRAAIEAKEAWEVLRQAIRALPANLRVVMQGCIDGKTDVQIAAQIGCTHQNVSLLHKKGIEFLRRNPNVQELRA